MNNTNFQSTDIDIEKQEFNNGTVANRTKEHQQNSCYPLELINDEKNLSTAKSTAIPHQHQHQQSNSSVVGIDSSITNKNGNCITATKETTADSRPLQQKFVWCRGYRVSLSIVWLSLVLIVVLLTVAVCYAMDWISAFHGIILSLVAVIATTSVWHWLGNWIYIAAVTAPRDIKAAYRYVKLIILIKQCQRNNVTIGDVFKKYVELHPNKPCFVFEEKTWTFKEVNDYANRIGNYYSRNGYKNEDVVGLIVENRPEFVCIWLGLSRIGVVTALINTNLRNAALLHSINVANCKGLIYSESLVSAIEEVKESLPPTLEQYQLNDKPNSPIKENVKDLTTHLQSTSTDDIVFDKKLSRHHDKLLYIYTSGTTGLSKAAVISHSRYIFIAAGIHFVGAFRNDDIFYTPLPLYHTAGGVMSIGQALLFGATVVIRKKFSASGYFADCQKYNCTIVQYIGEMCRYVLATPPSAADRNHCVRLAFGNGLRPQIWPQFVERFNVKNIAEFYGATEGNANIVNIDNTVGAIGFVSRIIPRVYPISIIRADPYTGEPIRGPDGLCQLCAPNEAGVFIGKIIPGDPSRAFLGYVDKKASSKKVVHDVFKKGDSAFISGDILVADERGYLFFKDRTGDTFRWKGENVSTSEVEALVSNVVGYRDTVAYGVEIPNLEGRAGMVAILDPNNTVDLQSLADGIKKVLPSYARPQFVRLLSKVDMTGTFKLRKLDLQKEGFNPINISDQLFYITPKGTYERLNNTIYNQIVKGEIRF